MKFVYPDGATPLDLDEQDALIPKHIATQSELNEWESRNILQAELWARSKKELLTLEFIQTLHMHMFNRTWLWAGKFRTTSGKNIGIDWHLISSSVKNVCDYVKYWLEKSVFSDDEIAVRFHHKLVWIHPFSNGNGRHARLIADLLIKLKGHSQFSWGSIDLYNESEIRRNYIQALKLADQGDYKELIIFARS